MDRQLSLRNTGNINRGEVDTRAIEPNVKLIELHGIATTFSSIMAQLGWTRKEKKERSSETVIPNRDFSVDGVVIITVITAIVNAILSSSRIRIDKIHYRPTRAFSVEILVGNNRREIPLVYRPSTVARRLIIRLYGCFFIRTIGRSVRENGQEFGQRHTRRLQRDRVRVRGYGKR